MKNLINLAKQQLSKSEMLNISGGAAGECFIFDENGDILNHGKVDGGKSLEEYEADMRRMYGEFGWSAMCV